MRYQDLHNNDYYRNQQFLISQWILDEELEQLKQMCAVKVIIRAIF